MFLTWDPLKFSLFSKMSICWKSTRQTVHGKIFQLFGFHFFHDILTELAVFTVAVPLTSLLWTQRAELLSHDISVGPRNIKKNLFQFQQYRVLPPSLNPQGIIIRPNGYGGILRCTPRVEDILSPLYPWVRQISSRVGVHLKILPLNHLVVLFASSLAFVSEPVK